MADPVYTKWPDGRELTAREISVHYLRNYVRVCSDIRQYPISLLYTAYEVGRKLGNITINARVVDCILKQYPSATIAEITLMCNPNTHGRVNKHAMVVDIGGRKVFIANYVELDNILGIREGYTYGIMCRRPRMTYQDVVDSVNGTPVVVDGETHYIRTSRQLSRLLGRSCMYVAQELRRRPGSTWQDIANSSASRKPSKPAKKHGIIVTIDDTVYTINYYRELDTLLGRSRDYTANLLSKNPEWTPQQVVEHSTRKIR